MAGDLIAADVVAYGGNARAGQVPKGGDTFLIDPNFLSYTPTPIEITAVVQKGPDAAPAKMEITYESPEARDGYKKGQAYEVPDGANWTTLTWKLTDAQFVSMYGYNFSFSKGNYMLKSVTVTKVGP